VGDESHKGVAVNPADLSEAGVDLDADRRTAILAAEARLGANHWGGSSAATAAGWSASSGG
jgi:hypothetical protein